MLATFSRLSIPDLPPETDQIEFKEHLSTKGDSDDRWITHGDRIGDKARNELLEEAVAFANAYGGAGADRVLQANLETYTAP